MVTDEDKTFVIDRCKLQRENEDAGGMISKARNNKTSHLQMLYTVLRRS